MQHLRTHWATKDLRLNVKTNRSLIKCLCTLVRNSDIKKIFIFCKCGYFGCSLYPSHTAGGITLAYRQCVNSPVLQLPSEVCRRSCNTLAKRPFTSTHLMSPYYTERQPSHNLIYTVDHTPLVTIARNSRIHLPRLTVPNSEAEIINMLKLP